MLIKKAGCHTFKEGDAIISKSIVIFVNNGKASSSDIENLIKKVKKFMRKLGKILSQRLKSQVNKKKFNKVLVVLGGTSGEKP